MATIYDKGFPALKDYHALAFIITTWPEFFEKAHIELHHGRIHVSDQCSESCGYMAKFFHISNGEYVICKHRIKIEDPECIEKLKNSVKYCDDMRENDGCEKCKHA